MINCSRELWGLSMRGSEFYFILFFFTEITLKRKCKYFKLNIKRIPISILPIFGEVKGSNTFKTREYL